MKRKTYRRPFRMFPLFFLAAALLMGGIVMWLWNAIVPSLLHVSPIKYWQAVGLLVLCRILFGNFHGRMGDAGRWNHYRSNNSRDFPGSKPSSGIPGWRAKWMNMTDEERKKFREEMRRRCRKPPQTE